MVVGVVEITKDLDMNISHLIAATSIAFLAASPLALAAALAEELPRQVRLCRFQQVVDPVVDLAEEAGTLAGSHVVSMLLEDGEPKFESEFVAVQTIRVA